MSCNMSGSDEDWNFSARENKSDEILLRLAVETESIFVILILP